jgi:hypothetical protein
MPQHCILSMPLLYDFPARRSSLFPLNKKPTANLDSDRLTHRDWLRGMQPAIPHPDDESVSDEADEAENFGRSICLTTLCKGWRLTVKHCSIRASDRAVAVGSQRHFARFRHLRLE